ncbi:hypothetical protein IW138_002806 [Coemansia sp. RSA 986]|nr:hypothetical protein IW138_002806 [Coemansia sp. RSA 986]
MQHPDNNYYQQPQQQQQQQQQQVPLMISVGSPTTSFNLAQQPPQHLVRYRHSCEHCSGTRPICDHCLRRGIQCIYKPLARTPRRTVSTGSGGGSTQQSASPLHNHGVQPISIPTSGATFLSPLASSSYLHTHTDIASAPAFHSMSPLLGYGIPLNSGAKTQQQRNEFNGSLPKSLRSPAPAIPSHMYNGGVAPSNIPVQSPLVYGSFNSDMGGTPGSFTSIQSDFSDTSPSQPSFSFNQVPVTPTKTSSSADTTGMVGSSGFLGGLQMDDPAIQQSTSIYDFQIPMELTTTTGSFNSGQHQMDMTFTNQGSMGFSLPNHFNAMSATLGGGPLDNGLSESESNRHERKTTGDSADSISSMPLLERSAMGGEGRSGYAGANKPNSGGGGISDEILSYYFSTQQQQQQPLHHGYVAGSSSSSSSSSTAVSGIAPGLTIYQHTSGSPSVANNTTASRRNNAAGSSRYDIKKQR